MAKWGYFPIKGYKKFLLKLIGHPHPHGRIIQKLIKRFLDINSRLTLDLGCGEGIYCLELSKRNGRIVGIDYAVEAIMHAKDRAMQAGVCPDLVVADAQELPFKDNCFEQLICLDVLEHIVDPDKVFREIKRVTFNEAKIIISVPNYYYFKRPVLPFDFSKHLKVLGHLHAGFFLEELKKKLKENGFVLVRFKYFHKFFSRLISEMSFLMLGPGRLKKARKKMYGYSPLSFLSFLIIYPIMRLEQWLLPFGRGGFLIAEAQKQVQ